jgi:glucose-6-phosphate isomerase
VLNATPQLVLYDHINSGAFMEIKGLPRMHRGHREEIPEYSQHPITLDYTFVMSEYLGPVHGLQKNAFVELNPRLEELDRLIKDWRAEGAMGFFDLPYDQQSVTEIKKLAKQFKEWCRDLLVLEVGTTAAGIKALRQALCHPSHNRFPVGRRQYHSRLFVSENIDPESFYGLLDDLELKRLAVNVISKSGETPATLAKFLFLYNLLQGRMDEAKARESFLFTTDPEQGSLRRLIAEKGFPSLSFPRSISSQFSILAAAGLFPAAMAGIDIAGLLAGARFMDQRLQSVPISQNPAYRLAACYYLALTQQGRSIQVIMPYTDRLTGLADWFCGLWAGSLRQASDPGEAVAGLGPIPLRAEGISDHYSLLPQVLHRPADKLVTFLEVAQFTQNLPISSGFQNIPDLNYLGGHTLTALLSAEKKAAALSLVKAGCPNLTIKIPEINAFTIGQLVYLCQYAIVSLAGLFKVDPSGEPEAAGIEATTCGLLGRSGYDRQRQEVENAAQVQNTYVV